MIRTFTLKNYKSILDHEIELGRLNVFIGENGSGKSNFLEAMAMAAAALTDKLDVEEIYARGVRVAKPSLTFSSFIDSKPNEEIDIAIGFKRNNLLSRVELSFVVDQQSAANIQWSDKKAPLMAASFSPAAVEDITALLSEFMRKHKEGAELTAKEVVEELDALTRRSDEHQRAFDDLGSLTERRALATLLNDFAIFNPNILALRGIQNVSRRTPLGIHGENLDVALSAMADEDREALIERARCISWLDDILLDARDQLKHEGYKFGRSTSTLYFRDRFMHEENNLFSAENTNEGILHILFYLVLFASAGTPKVFGIDNIETALNPQLCRDLIKQLAELAKVHDKQALITTHNPAILDGLNLHDDDQRLFVVSRNDDGHTVTERIRVKPETKDGKLKLSELWMRGHLGGIPQRF